MQLLRSWKLGFVRTKWSMNKLSKKEKQMAISCVQNLGDPENFQEIEKISRKARYVPLGH